MRQSFTPLALTSPSPWQEKIPTFLPNPTILLDDSNADACSPAPSDTAHSHHLTCANMSKDRSFSEYDASWCSDASHCFDAISPNIISRATSILTAELIGVVMPQGPSGVLHADSRRSNSVTLCVTVSSALTAPASICRHCQASMDGSFYSDHSRIISCDEQKQPFILHQHTR